GVAQDSPMSWQVRDGNPYYYLATRQNGRPLNRYMGRGPIAELAAAEAESRKAERNLVRQEIRVTQDCLIPLDKFVAELDEGVKRLLEAQILGAGYYRSYRTWRGARRVRSLAATT